MSTVLSILKYYLLHLHLPAPLKANANNSGRLKICGPGSYASPLPCSEAPHPCCNDNDCHKGHQSGVCDQWPGAIYCGGATPLPENVCVYPKCDASHPCNGQQACVRGGILGLRQNACMHAQCVSDSDCHGAREGRCLPFQDDWSCSYTGLFCTYATSPCRTTSDCPPSQLCVYNETAMEPQCVQAAPPPPMTLRFQNPGL